jgi:CTP synthase (UTP-ammonia lyase)
MKIRVGIIGDFDAGFQSHAATNGALEHIAALGMSIEALWLPTPSLETANAVEDFHGLWVAPGSPYKSLVGVLSAIRHAREHSIPLLGTCGGFQHIILEYARNVLGFTDAAHAEYDPYASKLFISRLTCSLVGRSLPITLKAGSLVAKAYGSTAVTEQYYCNFGVNPDYVKTLSSGALQIVGSDAEGKVRVVELAQHPFFVGTLFVPQFRSSSEQPHPLIMEFVRAAQKRAIQQV